MAAPRVEGRNSRNGLDSRQPIPPTLRSSRAPLLPASFVLSPAANVGRVEISRRKYTSRDNPRDVNVNFFLFPFPPKNIFFFYLLNDKSQKKNS
jgi:hypothetical protein